eukprot:Platyproteum_vivax@DN6184_c0_g1_i1.p2
MIENHAHSVEEPSCRVCFSTEQESEEGLIHPCRCDGSVKWIHPSCFAAVLEHDRRRALLGVFWCKVCRGVWRGGKAWKIIGQNVVWSVLKDLIETVTLCAITIIGALLICFYWSSFQYEYIDPIQKHLQHHLWTNISQRPTIYTPLQFLRVYLNPVYFTQIWCLEVATLVGDLLCSVFFFVAMLASVQKISIFCLYLKRATSNF